MNIHQTQSSVGSTDGSESARVATSKTLDKRVRFIPEHSRFQRTDGTWETSIEIEEGERYCTVCGEPQPYLIINDHVVRGCAGSSHYYMGRQIDHCSRPECCAEAERFLRTPNKQI